MVLVRFYSCHKHTKGDVYTSWSNNLCTCVRMLRWVELLGQVIFEYHKGQ